MTPLGHVTEKRRVNQGTQNGDQGPRARSSGPTPAILPLPDVVQLLSRRVLGPGGP